MKLTELNARFICHNDGKHGNLEVDRIGLAQGVQFCCLKCDGGHKIFAWGLCAPDAAKPASRWLMTGEDLSTLTLWPLVIADTEARIESICGWRCKVIDGRVIDHEHTIEACNPPKTST